MRSSHLLFLLVISCLLFSGRAQEAPQDPPVERSSDEKMHDELQQADGSASYESEEDKALMEEWDKHMHDFTPADMVTTHVAAKSKEKFFETVNQVPSYIRGAYFLENYGDENNINFIMKVVDPRGKVLTKKVNKKEGLFYFNVTQKGLYSFEFDNTKSSQEKQYSFAVHMGLSSETHLTSKDINPLQSRILMINSRIKEAQMKEKVIHNRFEHYIVEIYDQSRRFLTISIIETIVILFSVGWQISYIKKMLDSRRII